MNGVLEQINSIGEVFVEFARPMLVQSSVLIVILLVADFILRRKVRAVFRYWIWMLVLVKLVLPTSLSSPVSLGYWFGEELRDVKVIDTVAAVYPERAPQVTQMRSIEVNGEASAVAAAKPGDEPAITEAVGPPVVSVTTLTLEGVLFLVWLAVVVMMGGLLVQRAIFVSGLIFQAKNPTGLMTDVFEYCCGQMGLKGKVGLRVSANATSPAVCGLFRPVILVPGDLAPSLGASRLRAVLLHELAHIKRGDLWVSLAQTVLQILYFYNPLLWAANFVIRRVREQAVDEAVQVVMGERAREYPQMLVEVAKLAFKRPTLSLRLIGVVESKSALKGRIKRMLSRPIPRSAKLGAAGLLAVIVAGVVLLPMAGAESGEPKFVVKGTVTDARMGEPIAGAKVGDVEQYAKGKQWATTDADGNYSYKTWYEEHAVKCEAAGYKTETIGLLTKLFGTEKEKVIDFKLAPEEATGQSEFTATLPNGVTVELVGICDYPDDKVRCWRPNGAKLQKQIFATKWNKRNPEPDEFGFMFKLDGPEDLSFSWNKITGSNSWEGSCKVVDGQGNPLEGFEAAIALLRNKPSKTSVRVGIAVGPWKTVATHDGKGMCMKGGIAFASAYESNSAVRIVVTDNLGNEVVQRVVAIDENGNIHPCKGSSGSVSNQNLRQTTANFPDLKLNQVKEFQFQTRPYEWVEFKDVSLKPNFRTDRLTNISQILSSVGGSTGRKVVGIGPGWWRLQRVIGDNYGGSIGGYSDDEKKCSEYFSKVLSWAKPGDTFAMLFAFDEKKYGHSQTVPEQYYDLLPRSWSEVKRRVDSGETVELKGEARGLNTIVLAAPTLDQLEELIKKTELLEPFKKTDVGIEVEKAASEVEAAEVKKEK